MNRNPLVAPALLVILAACAADPPPPATVPAPPPPAPPVASAPPPAPAPAPAAPPTPGPDDKFAKVEIKVQKVAGNVYMLQGEGGNIGVLTGDDGIVIVDDQFAPLATKIRAALKGISDKPIKFILNTHWHGDHTGGNAAFSSDGSIVAQENVRKRLIEGRPKFEMAGISLDATPPAPKEALPVVTFEDNVSLHVDGEDIRAVHVPSGHTDGDVIVYFPKANVVHMGDDFITTGFPFADAGSGGSVRGMIAALDKVVAMLPADAKVIPGHGELSTIEDVKKSAATLKDIVAILESEVKKKKTVDQIKAAKVLAKYDDLGKGFIKTDMLIEMIYKELTAKPLPAKPVPAKPAFAKPATSP
jgi:glyoxylase-like metal-dependent hydrolase (beta-lactamase superfamily II)